MKKLCNTETDLKKKALPKKKRVMHFQVIFGSVQAITFLQVHLNFFTEIFSLKGITK